jgi:hypothetical protein
MFIQLLQIANALMLIWYTYQFKKLWNRYRKLSDEYIEHLRDYSKLLNNYEDMLMVLDDLKKTQESKDGTDNK